MYVISFKDCLLEFHAALNIVAIDSTKLRTSINTLTPKLDAACKCDCVLTACVAELKAQSKVSFISLSELAEAFCKRNGYCRLFHSILACVSGWERRYH